MKRPFQVTATIAMLILTAAYHVRAQEGKGQQPLQEVFQTEMVYPQEKGEVQITLSPTFGKGAGRNLFQTPLTLEYGLTDEWQVELEWQTATLRREAGDEKTTRDAGDLRLGTKYSLMNTRGSNFHGAVGLEVGLPTGSVEKELSEGFIEYEP